MRICEHIPRGLNMTRRVTIVNTSNHDEDVVVLVGDSEVVLRRGEFHKLSCTHSTVVMILEGESRGTEYLGELMVDTKSADG